jgi:hypothetical protein
MTSIRLERRELACNRQRFYAITVTRTLFGSWTLVRELWFATEGGAIEASVRSSQGQVDAERPVAECLGTAYSCSDLQSKTPQPAIIATFRPGLSATERRSNRNYLQLNLQSKIPNLQSKGLNRHYLQLKIRTWTGPENDRLLDAIPAATRSTSGVACCCPETQSRKQHPDSA